MSTASASDGDAPGGSAVPISFRQLKLFEAAGRLGTVTAAARECGLSQPAATQALAVLEQKAGFPLIERGAKGLALTPFGRELHGRVSLLLEKLDRGLQQCGIGDREHVVWQVSQAQLRLLNAMAERGSLERAAIVRAMTPRTARALELLVGQSLLAREDGATVLTGAGSAFARRIGLLADEAEWTVQDVREEVDRSRRTVVIGVAPDPGTASLNAVVKAFTARHPLWCLEILESGQKDLLARLAIGELDLVAGHILGDAGQGVSWEEMATVTYRIVGRRDHPLASRRNVAVRELVQYPWVFGAQGSQRRAASDALFAGRAQPHCCLVTSAAPMMAQLLMDSDRLGLMTDQELAQREATLVGIAHEAPERLAHIGVAIRSDWAPTPVHLDAVALLRARFAGTLDAG